MRPVNKGTAPKVYISYSEARHDLAAKIGYYCSYCEMKVFNSIEVEHILPQNQGGNVVDWDNFLLSCKYCNTIKSDHNNNLLDYVWPDIDNTDLVFNYSEAKVIEPKYPKGSPLEIKAQKTIDLMGLDRIPGGLNIPTKADTRWRSRNEAWDKAKLNLIRWNRNPSNEIAEIIADCAILSGHYSIWCEVFKSVPVVLVEIEREYTAKGLYKEYDANGNRVIRPNANI